MKSINPLHFSSHSVTHARKYSLLGIVKENIAARQKFQHQQLGREHCDI